MEIRLYHKDDQSDVIQLWQVCGLLRSHNDPNKDIARKLTQQPELFLVGLINNRIISTVMAGYDGHRGWLNYLAVSPNYQEQGVGRKIVFEAEERLQSLGCPKINLQIRTTNNEAIKFYHKMGYLTDDVVSMGKRLIKD